MSRNSTSTNHVTLITATVLGSLFLFLLCVLVSLFLYWLKTHCKSTSIHAMEQLNYSTSYPVYEELSARTESDGEMKEYDINNTTCTVGKF